MFSSTVLDVAVGLVFVFFVVSLAASAILEAIAGIITWRSGSLLKNIKDLLNDKDFTGLAAQLYQHALISPRNDGQVAPASLTGKPAVEQGKVIEKALRKMAPSYIDPKQFAEALTDILSAGKPSVAVPASAAAAPAVDRPGRMVSGNANSIARAIDYVVPPDDNPQVNALLRGISHRADGDLDKMRTEIATWFDNAMDRVSGVYKRWTQLWHFLIALVLTILLNLDAVHLAASLWMQPTVASSIEKNGNLTKETAADAVKELEALPLPIGWFNNSAKPAPGTDHERTAGEIYLYGAAVVLGWLITALAALFGAPFWFDLLQNLVRLKASGPSPREKQDKTAAAP